MRTRKALLYIVKKHNDEILLITRNPKTAAAIYFLERRKIRGERPYVYSYIVGIADSEKLLGYEELYKFHTDADLPKDVPPMNVVDYHLSLDRLIDEEGEPSNEIL